MNWIFLRRIPIQKLSITEKRQNKAKYLTPNSIRPACQTLLKALNISSASAQVVSDLLKALAIQSDTSVRRSAIDREDLKLYWKSEKRSHVSR